MRQQSYTNDPSEEEAFSKNIDKNKYISSKSEYIREAIKAFNRTGELSQEIIDIKIESIRDKIDQEEREIDILQYELNERKQTVDELEDRLNDLENMRDDAESLTRVVETDDVEDEHEAKPGDKYVDGDGNRVEKL